MSTKQNKALLHTALPEAIWAGKVTDVYFERTKKILERFRAWR